MYFTTVTFSTERTFWLINKSYVIPCSHKKHILNIMYGSHFTNKPRQLNFRQIGYEAWSFFIHNSKLTHVAAECLRDVENENKMWRIETRKALITLGYQWSEELVSARWWWAARGSVRGGREPAARPPAYHDHIALAANKLCSLFLSHKLYSDIVLFHTLLFSDLYNVLNLVSY